MFNIIDLLQWMQQIREKLQGKIDFDEDGYPLFKESDFVANIPEDMVDFSNRNNHRITTPKGRTLLVFYEADRKIYPRFYKLEQELPIYQQYAGVAFPDVTITADMDEELQLTLSLANQLFAAYLVSKGVKVAVNTRATTSMTRNIFRNIPRHVMCVSGFLGCKASHDFFEASRYTDKILSLQPSYLLIYGKARQHDKLVDEQLDMMGVDYRYYEDFHSKCHRGVA